MDLFPIAQSELDRLGKVDWRWMEFLCIAFGAIGFLLLQRGLLKSKSVATSGGVLLVGAGILATITFTPGLDTYILLAFCGLALGGGVAFLVVRQPVYAALGFATAILSGTGVLFMQSALFVAAATMIVYAGATIIIFLFVLMFSQHSILESYEIRLTNPVLAAIAGAVLFGAIVFAIQESDLERDEIAARTSASQTRAHSAEVTRDVPSSTAGLGRAMFTDYLFTIELAGTLLLVATIGAISVAQRTAVED